MTSSSEVRAHNYGLAGQVMVLTALELGASITDETQAGWVDTTSRLAGADDVSETTPERLDAFTLLDILGLPDDNPQLIEAANGLLLSSQDAIHAPTIGLYFKARKGEAIETTNLLRYQSPMNVRDKDELWGQLSGLVIMSTYFDTFLDYREDAQLLPQFSASQLVRGSLVRLIGTARQLEIKTAVACAKACHETGIDKWIVKKLPETLLGASL